MILLNTINCHYTAGKKSNNGLMAFTYLPKKYSHKRDSIVSIVLCVLGITLVTSGKNKHYKASIF